MFSGPVAFGSSIYIVSPPLSIMSESCEISSCHLTLTIGQQQQLGDTPTYTSASPKDRRRKRSLTSSNGTIADTKPTSSRRRSGITKTLATGSDAGSSRTAQRSTTSPNNMSTVSYTKTGRVSKAKKGLKVHDCECGRSYTRAEHLRRHQRNHAQEGAMVCKYPSCGKTFYRSDLLQRHEERHNELGNVSRQPSVSSIGHSTHTSPKTAPASLLVEPSSAVSHAVSYPQQQASSPRPEITPFPRYNPSLFRTPQFNRTPKIAPSNPRNHVFHSSPIFKTPTNEMKQQNLAYPARHSISGSVLVDGMVTSGAWQESFAQSPYSCSSGYASPALGPDYGHIYGTPPYGHGVVRTRASSNASFIEQTWAHASQSPTSSISMPYSWPSSEKNIIVSSFPYTSVSYHTANMPMHASIDPMTQYGNYNLDSVIQMDNEEGAQLFPDEHYGMSQSARTFPYEHFLNNYWRLFHPFFPVVHRFTFASLEPTSMLYAAMIAIGAHYSNATSYARELHDRCVKLLVKRHESDVIRCDRLCDFQAIFLVEHFALNFARRCARTLSTRFLTMYEKLVGSPSTDPSAITDPVLLASIHEDNVQDQWLQWAKLSMRQRLLLSCYLLEFRQSTLLAPDHKSPIIRIPWEHLPFPSYNTLWEAPNPSKWLSVAQKCSLTPRNVSEATSGHIVGCYDSFQSSILIAAHYNPFSSPTLQSGSSIDQLLHDDPTTRHQLLTAKLVQLAPIFALLAVSGETWVLGTKVTSQSDFAAQNTELQAWISQLWACSADGYTEPTAEALHISVSILKQFLRTTEPLVHGLGFELGLFYAALVLWAATAAANSRLAASCFSTQQSQPPPASQFDIATTTQLTIVPYSTNQSTYLGPIHHLLGRKQEAPPSSSGQRTSVSHSEILSNTSQFLESAFHDLTSFNVAVCDTGCTSLLLWVKMLLRGAFLNDQNDTIIDMISSKNDYGELVNEAIGQIERMLNRGWEGWGI